MAEIHIQAEAWKWGVNTFQLYRKLFHVPNEMAPYPGESKKAHMLRIQQMKAQGMTPGEPDLVLVWKGRVYGFELKVAKKLGGRLSEDQIKCAARWAEEGSVIYPCWTLDEFKKKLTEIITTV